MRVVLASAWETARRVLQSALGWTPYHSKTEVYANAVAKQAFRVTHSLPFGIAPTSAWGTAMADGYVYYTEADRTLWTPNTPAQEGEVWVRCSVAKAKCEVHVAAFDE